MVLLVLLEVLCEEVHGVGGTLLGQRGQGLQQDRHDGLELMLISTSTVILVSRDNVILLEGGEFV